MLPPLAISKVNLLVCMAYKLNRRGNLKFWTMAHQTLLYTPMERSMIKPVDLTGLSVRSPCQRRIRRTTLNRYGQGNLQNPIDAA